VGKNERMPYEECDCGEKAIGLENEQK